MLHMPDWKLGNTYNRDQSKEWKRRNKKLPKQKKTVENISMLALMEQKM